MDVNWRSVAVQRRCSGPMEIQWTREGSVGLQWSSGSPVGQRISTHLSLCSTCTCNGYGGWPGNTGHTQFLQALPHSIFLLWPPVVGDHTCTWAHSQPPAAQSIRVSILLIHPQQHHSHCGCLSSEYACLKIRNFRSLTSLLCAKCCTNSPEVDAYLKCNLKMCTASLV